MPREERKSTAKMAERLARLQARAAGDPTGTLPPTADQQGTVASLIQQSQTAMPAPAAMTPPSADALTGAYQAALNQKVQSLNAANKIEAMKRNLAQFETTRKNQSDAYQQRFRDTLADESDASIPANIRTALSGVIDPTGTIADPSQGQAIAALKNVKDSDLQKAGWSRDQLTGLVNSYYKPGTKVNPAMDPNAISGADSYSLFGLNRPAATANPQAQVAQPGSSNFQTGAGIVNNVVDQALFNPSQNFGAGVNEVGSTLMNTGPIKGIKGVGKGIGSALKYAFGRS